MSNSLWDYPRSAWLPAGSRWDGPPFQPRAVTTVVIHYQGSDSAPNDVRVWARNVHQMTLNKPSPYVFMYSAAVDRDGRILQGRGFDLRNAANKNHNEYTFAICLLIPGKQPASDRQVAAVRRLVGEIRARCAGGRIIAHRDIGATACPGDGVAGQIRSGMFEPNLDPPVPPPPAVGGDVEMIVLDWRPNTPNWVAFLWTGETLAHIVDGHADAVLRRVKTVRTVVSDDELGGVIRSSKTIGQPPAPLPSALKTLWTAPKR